MIQMTKIVGLTGGIASGKTTISNYFKEINIPIVDADLVAHEVMRAGKPAVAEIVRSFGQEILLEDGEINRKLLGKIVFESERKREKLNRIVQQKIREEIKKEMMEYLKDKPALIVLDIPLLYEQSYEEEVDEVMVVYVNAEVQKKRLLKRDTDLSESDAINRIKSQMPITTKAKRADRVIDNNGTIDQSIQQVNEWLSEKFGKEAFEEN